MFVQKAIQMSIFIFQCMHVCKIKPRFVYTPENGSCVCKVFLN